MDLPEIKKLDECVLNRIAAGEIIQKPANVLKELMENSLDKIDQNPDCRQIGRIKIFEHQDTGTGIRRDNLEIVCERFTTSKLQTWVSW
jgi:DNA mismatch repair protein MLH1